MNIELTSEDMERLKKSITEEVKSHMIGLMIGEAILKEVDKTQKKMIEATSK
jgi:hypothetical protein